LIRRLGQSEPNSTGVFFVRDDVAVFVVFSVSQVLELAAATVEFAVPVQSGCEN